MFKQILTIDNWRSEYQRLQTRYRLTHDKNSLEALGLIDHMQAVLSIINDIGIKPQVTDNQTLIHYID